MSVKSKGCVFNCPMSSSKVTTKPLTLCSLYGTVPVEALDASRELLYAVSPASSSFRRDVIAFEPLRRNFIIIIRLLR